MSPAILGPEDLLPHHAALAHLEAQRTYPLGPGARFRIDHGHDYARFFARLGRPRFVLAREPGGEIAGVAAAVRMSLDPARTGLRHLWYLCDLKTAPGASQGTLRALLHQLDRATGGLRPGAFFVAMDEPADGPTRRTGIARLLEGRRGLPRFEAVAHQRIGLVPVPRPAGAPRRWSRFERREAIEGGAVAVRSLAGVKDLVLLPAARKLRVAHVAIEPDEAPAEVYAAGITRGAAIAASLAAETVCFSVDAGRRAHLRALADRGFSAQASATTYYHSPDSHPWPGLTIRTDEI